MQNSASILKAQSKYLTPIKEQASIKKNVHTQSMHIQKISPKNA